MPITPQMQLRINNISMAASSVGAEMIKSENLMKMFQLTSKLVENPDLYEEFKNNPEQVVLREIGAFGSAGTHFHTADEDNNYIPEEGGAVAQLMKGKAAPDEPWVRVEVRAGIGPLCWFNCGWCT